MTSQHFTNSAGLTAKGIENPPTYHFENSAGQHAHFLGDRPLVGTSSVCKILSKPLTWWASGLAVQTFGCPDPRILTKIKNKKATPAEIAVHESAVNSFFKQLQRITLDDYLALLDRAYRAHQTTLKDKAEAGVDLHTELERFVKDHMAGKFGLYPDQIQPFIKWTYANVKRFLYSEAHCYSEELWTGGISDAGYEDKDGNFGIIDFKSAKSAYFEHFAQEGGYDIALSENGALTADGELLYKLEKPITRYAIVAFGAAKVEPQFYENPETMRKVFCAMLTIYKEMPKE